MRKPYSSYKPTSIQWLPSIPVSWDLVKAKFLFNERVQKGYEDEPLLAATQLLGVIPKSLYENTTVTAQKDFHLLKFVEVGDFVISLRSFQGGIEYAYYKGIISPAYTIFYPKNKKQINSQFFKYFFKSQPFIYSLKLFVTGIREGQNIDYSQFKDSLLPMPSYLEQTAIANYLDAKTHLIDTFISKKQKLIELLREKIYVKVQSSFNTEKSNSKFWPFIPSDWKVERSKRIFIAIDHKNQPGEQLLAVTQDRGVLPKSMCSQDFVSPSNDYNSLKLVDVNDFIISLRSFQGGIEYSFYKGLVSPAYTVIRLKPQFNNSYYINYFKYLFKTPQMIAMLNTAISGIRDGKNINWDDFCNLLLPIPSVNDIKDMQADFNKYEFLVRAFENEKKLIDQYNKSLIAEVVTGKINVL